MPTLAAIPIFSQLVDTVANLIRFLRDHTGGSLGVAIILFTIFVKLLLAPLTFKSIKSSKAMQDIAPEMKRLQKEYKDDKAKFAEEQMKLYQQYGVNPLAGCLPVAIQLPVFLIVYNAMRQVATHDSVGGHFLWVADLTKNIGSVAPNGHIVDPFRILVFLAFIFQIIQTRMSLPHRAKRMQQDQQTRTQSLLISGSSALVLVFGWNFIAAMVLYWAVQAIFSAIQQYFITGWGALSDVFTFLPIKAEPVRPAILPVANRKPPGRLQQWMQQSAAMEQAKRGDQSRDEDTTAATPAVVKPRQPLGPDGRPKRGSTVSISGGVGSTAPQRSKAAPAESGEDGTSRGVARAKGAPARASTTKAIGTSEGTRAERVVPPAPRKTRMSRPTGNEQTGGGGGGR